MSVLTFLPMGSGRIKWYICKEVLGPAGIALLVLTAVLFLGRLLRLLDLVIDKGVPAEAIARLLSCLLPFFLVYTLPLSLLIGILIAFGRLAADREIIAMQSAGLSLKAMAAPILALAVTIALLVALLGLWGAPAGNSVFRQQLFRIAADRAAIALQPGRFVDDFSGLVIYARQVDGRTGEIKGVMVADERFGPVPVVIIAEAGRLATETQNRSLTLFLERGTIHRQPAPASPMDFQTIAFEHYELGLSMGSGPADLTRPARPKEIGTGLLISTPVDLQRRDDRQRRAELHRRLALPLAPLLFTLIGVPLGVRQQRMGRSGGFAAGLLIFLAYYLGLSLAEILSVEAAVPAAIPFWTLQLSFATVGIWLFCWHPAGNSHFPHGRFPELPFAQRRRPVGRNSRP